MIRDSRGVAVVDLDHDGRLDLVLANNDAPPSILWNRSRSAGRWLALELVGRGPQLPATGAVPRPPASPRDPAGARVRVTLADPDKTTLVRWLSAGSGYASQSPWVVHFGLGDTEGIAEVEVLWPSGRVDRIAGDRLALDRRWTVFEGTAVVDPVQARAGGPPTHSTASSVGAVGR